MLSQIGRIVVRRSAVVYPVRTFATPSFTEKVKEAYDISKEHVKAAMKNQKQGMEDVAEGRASVGDVAREHGKEAKLDMKQWKEELKEVRSGELPGQAKVRDLPPMQKGTVRDNVERKPTSKGQ